jgi:methylated-DNA-[protein]-cysteine S-methyltransferase
MSYNTTMTKSLYFYDMPIGRIALVEEDGALTNLCFSNSEPPTDAEVRETPLLKQAASQLHEYFAGTRRTFDLPLRLSGTAFQVAAWEALCTILYGQTRSYKEMAVQIGKPKAARAVGGANNRNPIAIIVPCHRVIGASGSLVGFAGGLDIKQQLLALEKNPPQPS